MNARLLTCTLALSILAGCANVQPVLSPTAEAEQNSGYVAGAFSPLVSRGFMPFFIEKHGFAFVIQAVGSNIEYQMPLGAATRPSKEMKPRTIAIKLPPGTYTIPRWIWYDTLTTEIIGRFAIKSATLKQPFTIAPGMVHHLGSYDLSEESPRGSRTAYMDIVGLPVNEGDMSDAFARAYPNLAELPLHCALCVDNAGKTPPPAVDSPRPSK